MIRWAAAFATVSITAIFLALFEPALAMSDTQRLVFIVFSVALFRSPVWLSSFLGNRRVGSA